MTICIEIDPSSLPHRQCLGHSGTLPKFSEWVDKKFAEENRGGPNEHYLMCDICQGFFPFTLTKE